MYHDVKHENGCIGLDLISPEMRDCTCGKILDCLLAEREHLHVQASKTAARIERLEKALLDAVKWISEECCPDAEWVAQGHNWSMSDEDRARGSAVLKGAHAALSKPDGSASK